MPEFDLSDPNATAAWEALRNHIAVHEYKAKSGYARLSAQNKQYVTDQTRGRLRAMVEEGDYKMAVENGTFCCRQGYVFNTVVEQVPTYRIYRCDGGHHYGIVFTEYKERHGATGNERRIVIKNGEPVIEEGQARSNDQFELD